MSWQKWDDWERRNYKKRKGARTKGTGQREQRGKNKCQSGQKSEGRRAKGEEKGNMENREWGKRETAKVNEERTFEEVQKIWNKGQSAKGKGQRAKV